MRHLTPGIVGRDGTSRSKEKLMFASTKTSLGVTWVLALSAAVWVALASASLAAWAAVVCIALMPAVVAMVMANTPAKSMAEIIRDVESGRPR